MESLFNNAGLEMLLAAGEIQARVAEMGRQIADDYTEKSLLLVGVLKGACVFMADLMRQIDLPLAIDFIGISSYAHSTTSSGEVRITKDLDVSLAGKDVLIVEDIVDTGLTLNYLMTNFRTREASSVEIVTLLDKPARHQIDIKPRYIGFTIPNRFVVGYGLDVGEAYRNIPFIAALAEGASL